MDPLWYVREWRSRFLEGGCWHSFELPDGSAIRGVSSLDAQKMRIAQFPIPADLKGKRVLDVGAWDGWFSFEMERRGAAVLAIDRFENPRFCEIRERLGSRVEYRRLDVYDVSPRSVGYFDIVLFLGVLYHLKHPLLALERVCSVARDMAAVESFVLTGQHGLTPEQEEQNLVQFYENDEFGGQLDNWFAPTASCLLALCRTAGFARVELSNRHEFGAAVTCYRKWEHPGDVAAAGPRLLAAVNADDFGINFRSGEDTFVSCALDGPGTGLSRASVFPEVGGYGVPPVYVGTLDDGSCHVHFRLPPGLTAGWHDVRLRTAGSAASNAVAIAVDMDPVTDHIDIRGACDGVSWAPSRMSLRNGALSLWVAGLPGNADINNVRVHVERVRQAVTYVGIPDAAGVRQVNVRVARCDSGHRLVRVSSGAAEAAVPVWFEQ